MKRTKAKRDPARIQPATKVQLPKRTHQPSKAEQEAEMDMPKLSLKRARAAFMRPFRFVHDPD